MKTNNTGNTPRTTAADAVSAMRTYSNVRWAVLWSSMFLIGLIGHALLAEENSLQPFLWPIAGIGFAAAYILGVRAWLPISLAYIALLLALPAPWHMVHVLTTATLATSSVLQALVAGAILRRYSFSGTFRSIQDALLVTAVAVFVPIIAPTIVTLTSLFAAGHGGPWNEIQDWVLSYGVSVSSVFVFLPLVSMLMLDPPKVQLPKQQLWEGVTAFCLVILTAGTLFSFTTYLPVSTGYALLYVLTGALLWIALRFGTHTTIVAVSLTTLVGVVSVVMQLPTTGTELSEGTFQLALLTSIISPILYTACGLSEERNHAIRALARRTNALERSVDRLSDEDRSKDEFIAMLGHELRNPLAAILSALELMEAQDVTRTLRGQIASIQTQSQAMRTLLDDLLDVARIRQRRFHVEKQYITLHSILERPFEIGHVLAKGAKIRLQVATPAEQCWVYGDQLRLEQAVSNLITNAVKYTPSGGTVRVHATLNPNSVRVSVSDTGAGIAKERLETIFGLFHQNIKAKHSEHAHGLGLGLWLTKRFVEIHKGIVTATSPGIGKGSTFTIELPRIPDERIAKIQAADKQNSTPEDTGTYHILLVDDNESAVNSLAQLLRLHGHSTTTVYTGTKAIEAVNADQFDVILLDIGLPDMDGFDVAGTLRTNGFEGIIATLTGYGRDWTDAHKQDGVIDIELTKPVSITDLDAAFRTISH